MWKREVTESRWEACDPTDIFYHKFIAEYWEGGPSEETAPTVHRLCTLARKMGVKSYIIEDALHRADVVDEIDHLEEFPRREETGGSVNAFTATFLTSPARTKDRRYDLVEENEIIGQFTIITFPFRVDDEPEIERRSYVYEAVFRIPSKCIDLEELLGNAVSVRVKKALPTLDRQQLLNNYVPVAADLDVEIHGRTLQIPAAYFCQQNGVTSFCAHCAVRTFVRTCARRLASTRRLNELWPSYTNPEPRVRPSVGPKEVVRALEVLGEFSVVSYNLDGKAPSVFAHEETEEDYAPDQIWSVLGLMADSATPGLLILSADPAKEIDHIVPILGHTFNSDEWHPIGWNLHRNGNPVTLSATAWIDHLVIHDDMLGPYYCLSRGGLFPGDLEDKLVPKQLIAIMPEDIELSPVMAEIIVRRLTQTVIDKIKQSEEAGGEWWEHFVKDNEKRVLRTTLVDSTAYMETLRSDAETELHSGLLDALAEDLPHHIWLIEITLPNLLLANQHKLGEFLIDPSTDYDDLGPDRALLAALLAFRMPSVLGLNQGPVPDGDHDFTIIPWPETAPRDILHKRHGNIW